MENFTKYIISQSITVFDALKVLNQLSDDALTLLIIDDEERMIGTLTDGDIRRYLISGGVLTDNVTRAMFKSFSYITINDNNNVRKIQSFKRNNISLVPLLNNNSEIVDVCNFKKIKSILPLDVVLMAGGKGERLKPLTDATPKPLLKLGDKSIIDHNIQMLRSFGIKNINITVNYLKEQLIDHFKNDNIACISEPIFLGTFGSVKLIAEFLNEDILVMNSDLFTDINLEDFYLNYIDSNSAMSIAVIPYQVNIPYGIFEYESDNCSIKCLNEKPTYNYYANAGIYLIKRELLKLVPSNVFYNANEFINTLLRLKYKVTNFPISGYWIDIGKHDEYQKAKELIKYL